MEDGGSNVKPAFDPFDILRKSRILGLPGELFIQTCACLEQERHHNSVVTGGGDAELAVDAGGEHGSAQRAYLP